MPLAAGLDLGVGLDLGAELYCLTCEEGFQHEASVDSSQVEGSNLADGSISDGSDRKRRSASKAGEAGDLPPKLFSCSLCAFTSRYSNHLKRHMRTHDGQKPYRCPVCPYASAQLVNLQRHARTHTGEKPYGCHQCSYACSSLGNLRRHQRMHTQERPQRRPKEKRRGRRKKAETEEVVSDLTLRVSQDSGYLQTLGGLGSPSAPLPVLLFPLCCRACGLTLEEADLDGEKAEGDGESDGGQLRLREPRQPAATRAHPLGRQALPLRRLRLLLQPEHEPEEAHAAAHGREAVRLRRKNSHPKLFPGDIVEYPRNKYFSHFAVYYGEKDGVPYVAHLTCRDSDSKLPLFGRALRSEVKLDPLELLGEKYKVNNMLDSTHPARDFHGVVKQAIDDMMGREVTFDILFHNSEHQATLFRYGVKKSEQQTSPPLATTWVPSQGLMMALEEVMEEIVALEETITMETIVMIVTAETAIDEIIVMMIVTAETTIDEIIVMMIVTAETTIDEIIMMMIVIVETTKDEIATMMIATVTMIAMEETTIVMMTTMTAAGDTALTVIKIATVTDTAPIAMKTAIMTIAPVIDVVVVVVEALVVVAVAVGAVAAKMTGTAAVVKSMAASTGMDAAVDEDMDEDTGEKRNSGAVPPVKLYPPLCCLKETFIDVVFDSMFALYSHWTRC
ncbi:Zinc finger protein 513 [Larimichthys crocea]|uniref:Uncharacterized protein n=1 Tax=Larimichthys crocea TaxID=215358 RepID=A0ACD3QZH9_LARCR|nr:Zinc finger protein 513 [Larimichthys crocea]